MPLATVSGAPSSAPSAKDSAPALLVPFTRAATEHVEGFLDTTLAIGAGSTPIPPTDVPAYGFMRGIYVEVTASGGVGAATFAGDAPFNAITDVTLSDVNGAPIVGPLDGYDVYLADKYGGYRKLQDPKLHPDFSKDAATGNFSFLLYIPVEVNLRDALGSLGNMNAASSYKLRITVAPKASIYTAGPATTTPTVRVRAWLDAWSQPPATSIQGQAQATEPPAHGTTSFWSKQTFNVSAGQQQLRLSRVGNYIRNLFVVYRDATGARNKASFPQPLTINWDTRVLKEYQQITWRGIMAQKYGLTGTDEAARALDTGVYVEDYCHEFDGHAGAELRDGWLPTVQSTRLELVGNFLAAGTLTVITNDVSPNGEVFV